MRALGIDLGERRIGVAVSSGSVASPIETVVRSGDRAADHRRLLALADEWEVDVVVVGLPLSLDGSEGPAARAARAEMAELAAATSRPVVPYDERLTSVTANRLLHEGEVPGRARRKVVDQLAAAATFSLGTEETVRLRVAGRGKPEVSGTGYSAYGSLGSYSLTGFGNQEQPPSAPIGLSTTRISGTQIRVT